MRTTANTILSISFPEANTKDAITTKSPTFDKCYYGVDLYAINTADEVLGKLAMNISRHGNYTECLMV